MQIFKKKLIAYRNTQRVLKQPEVILLHGADDKSIAINSTLDGNTKEGVVVDILGTGTGGGSTHGSATGKGNSNNHCSCDQSEFFHDKTPLKNDKITSD